MEKDQIKEQKILNIILVHGTWGRGFFRNSPDPYPEDLLKARWFSKGSFFRYKLDESLADFTLKYHEFFWSGSNTTKARAQSAKDLAVLLSVISGEKVIICHSHAGNIGAIALQNCKDCCKLVTLATPFVEIPTKDRPAFRNYIDYSTSIAFYGIFVSAIVYWINDDLRNSYIIGGALISFITYSIFKNVINRAVNRIFGSNGYFYKSALEIEKDTKYSIPRQHKILVIRGIDDEANLALSAGVLANRLVFLVGKFSTISVWTIITLLILTFIMGLYENATSFLFECTFQLSKYILYSHLGLLFTCSIIATGCKASFGWNLLFRTIWSELKINSSPDVDGSIKIVTLSDNFQEITQFSAGAPTYRIARHFIYNHPRATIEICVWLKSQNRRPDTP